VAVTRDDPGSRHDLVLRGGTIVSPGHREIADVGVRDGRIAQLGGAMTGQDELDASGLLVMPGGVDAHSILPGICVGGIETVSVA